MKQSEWTSRWSQNQIGFHQSSVANFLDKYAERVWGPDGVRLIYVPLCGKSLDMVYVAGIASEVVGSEFVEQAVVEFFAERDLAPTIETEPEVRYNAGNYTLFAADFFALTEEHIGTIDAVFDRAALVALDRGSRIKYADHMRSILPRGARTLLITFDYDQTEMVGPPFAVSHDEVQRLFNDGFKVEHLETRDVINKMFRARGLTGMTESAFALTRS